MVDNIALIIMEVNHMKRPSIFSSDYNKEVKKRKKILSLLIIIPIIGLIIFLSIGFNGLLNKGTAMKKGINNIFFNKSKEDKTAKVVIKQQTDVEKSKVKRAAIVTKSKASVNNLTFIVSLPDGQKITVKYSVVAANKTIKGVSNTKGILYDISPSKKAMVIQSTKNQDLIYVNVDKTSKDITRKVYTSSKNEDYSKDQQLKNSPDYIWSIKPKFIDEDNIAYVSELPWMNEKKVKYIWKLNLKDNVHMQVNPASGTKITFGKVTLKGLEANIDGNVVHVTSLGEATK